jgi:hypothetical protein
VSNHPRHHSGTSELHFIAWSSYWSYVFEEEGAVRINRWGEAKIKTPASAA